MLGIGIDWTEDFHDIALGTQEKGVTEQFRIDHGPAGVAALIERALRLEPDPAEVRVVLETRHGLLVEALIDAGFTVVPVNPRAACPYMKMSTPEKLLRALREGRDEVTVDPEIAARARSAVEAMIALGTPSPVAE